MAIVDNFNNFLYSLQTYATSPTISWEVKLTYPTWVFSQVCSVHNFCIHPLIFVAFRLLTLTKVFMIINALFHLRVQCQWTARIEGNNCFPVSGNSGAQVQQPLKLWLSITTSIGCSTVTTVWFYNITHTDTLAVRRHQAKHLLLMSKVSTYRCYLRHISFAVTYQAAYYYISSQLSGLSSWTLIFDNPYFYFLTISSVSQYKLHKALDIIWLS